MLSASRANLISKIIFTTCVLIATATVCLVTHELMTSSHHATLLLRRHTSGSDDQQSSSGNRIHGGLLDLIANVTQAVVAMEMQAQQLDEELQRMRQKTRQLLWQRRKDALWTAIHKCVFFYGCNKQNIIPRASRSVANRTSRNFLQNTAFNFSDEVESINKLTVEYRSKN